jgi:hypothetical protein
VQAGEIGLRKDRLHQAGCKRLQQTPKTVAERILHRTARLNSTFGNT